MILINQAAPFDFSFAQGDAIVFVGAHENGHL
jgi:hypothetical protein